MFLLKFSRSKRWVSLVKSDGHKGRYSLKQGNYLHNLKNHSQLPNILIVLSFFGSISHHFKFNRDDIWLYWGYHVLRSKFPWWKFSIIEIVTAQNRAIPCRNLKITHKYLILFFYYHFLVHFLIISRLTELIFDFIEVFRSKRWGFLGIIYWLLSKLPETW